MFLNNAVSWITKLQVFTWNENAIKSNDYIKLEIPQTVGTEDGKAFNQMVEPIPNRAHLTNGPKIKSYWHPMMNMARRCIKSTLT